MYREKKPQVPVRRPFRPHLEHLETRLAPANVDVLTYHNDPFLSGQNRQEDTLTPANVNSTTFGQLFSQPVDGYVYAEPLYKANLKIGDGTANVAFVATEHDSVYAIDTDSPTAGPNKNGIYWQTSFLDPAHGITTIPSPGVVSNSDIVPEIGITGTPVIDGGAGTLYIIAKTLEVRGSTSHYVQKLHALDITTGNERTTPYLIADTTQGGNEGGWTNSSAIRVNGVGDGASGGVIRFNAARENNRSALQLINGLVYVSFAAHSDYRPYHGWLVAFDETTLQPVQWFNTAPNAGGIGIWQSGGAVSVDPDGNLYFAVGNGFAGPQGQLAFDPNLGNWSESVLKLSTNGQLSVLDYFTPNDWRTLDTRDADLGSGGVMLLPDSVASAAHPHLMIETGKSGKIYLIDRDNLGQNVPQGQADRVVQITTAGQAGVWGNPAFYQIDPSDGIIYYHGSGDVLKGYYVSNGHIEDGSLPGDRPIMQSPRLATLSNFPGTQPVISANAIDDPDYPVNGIVWELQVDNFGGGTPNGNKPLQGPAYLRAYDATDLTHVLYDSKLIGDRDLTAEPVKFTVPTVANGHVLVGQARTFLVFGLFPDAKTAPAAPTDLAVAVGVGSQGPEIRLNWTNPDPAKGAAPTGIQVYRSSGSGYSLLTTVFRTATSFTDTGPFQVGQRFSYRVSAVNQLGESAFSNVVSAVVPIPSPILTVTGAGASSIGLSWTGVANGHYDIERSSDGVNFAPVATVPAFQTSYTDTGLAAGLYTYRIHAYNASPAAESLSSVQGQWVGTTLDYGGGFINATDVVTNGNTFISQNEQLIRLTNADTQRGSAFSNTRIAIGQFATSFQVRLHEGTQPNYADGFTFVIQANAPTALGQGGAGLGYQGIGHSVAVKFSTFRHSGDPSTSSTNLVVNGANPSGGVDTTPSGVLLDSQDIKQVDLTYDGATLTETITDTMTGAVFTRSYTVDIASVIGSDTAYIGFTGSSGTSNYWQLEDVMNWTWTSGAALPGAPTNLRETAFASSAIDLAWNSNSYNEAGFQVERSTDGTHFTPVGTTTDRTFEDSGLAPGTYTYRVLAYDDQGNVSPYSNTIQFRLPGAVLTDHQDVGTTNDPAIAGSATFANGTYTLRGSGTDIWDQADHFQYLYRPFLGSGEIIARVVSVTRADYWSKAGVMFREDLSAGAKNAFMFETPPPDHNTPIMHWRNQANNASVEIYGPNGLPAPIWVRLTRLGNVFTGYYARDNGNGTHGPWIQLGPSDTIFMSPNIYVGLALTGHTNSTTSTAMFDHVQILPFGTLQTTHLDVSGGGVTIDPGTAVSIHVQTLDLFNNPVPLYRGTVHFASSDPSAVLPADYTFTLNDNGRHDFTIIFYTPGYQTITVTDVDLPVISGSTALTVTGAPASGADRSLAVALAELDDVLALGTVPERGRVSAP